MRDQQKERLWKIRKEIMDLVNEALNLIGKQPLNLAAKGDHDNLKCIVTGERGDGINKALRFEQAWHGKGETTEHFLNVGVIVHTANSR